MTSKTLKELGIPFPLFDAPASQAPDYQGHGTCIACREKVEHSFRLGIGCYVIVECAGCSSTAALDADDKMDGVCEKCDASVAFPVFEGQVAICYSCLRAGRAAISKDSELGLISWEQALEGVTQGLPGLRNADFELVTRDGGWTGAKVPKADLLELLRTPKYLTWQGEVWQFCCKRPMTYIGSWGEGEFSRKGSYRDKNLLLQHFSPEESVHVSDFDGISESGGGVYIFQCATCQKMRSHYDMS